MKIKSSVATVCTPKMNPLKPSASLRHLLCLALAASGLALAAALPGHVFAQTAAQTTILFNSFIQPQHPINIRILKPWAEDISKATAGRVKFDFPTTSLSAPPQQMEGVTKGVMDGAYQFHGFLNNVKLTQIAHLPFVNTTAKGGSVALWRTYEKYFAKADEFKDVQLIGLFIGLPGPIYTMKGPITSAADMKGMKMFGLPGIVAKVLEGAGAGVVAAPAVRSHEIISGGTVDAFAGYSVMDAVAFNTMSYAKTVVDFPGHLSVPAFAMFINKKKWASIPQADRDIVAKLSGEAFSNRFALYDEIESKTRAEWATKGVSFVNASPAFLADLKKISEPMEQAWIADANKLGVDGKAALEFYKAEARANAK
jgi:TRAP-type C4-dicarboxylate transport system substrate-binding protein